MFINNPTQIILKENKQYAFHLVATTKEQAQEMQKAFNEDNENKYPFIKQVEVIGKSKDANKSIASVYIPIEQVYEKSEILENNHKKKIYWTEVEYKCYCRGKKIVQNNLIIHEEPLSALRCAIYRIGNPEYVYIVRTFKGVDFEEIINKEVENYDATNNSGDTSICEESPNE